MQIIPVNLNTQVQNSSQIQSSSQVQDNNTESSNFKDLLDKMIDNINVLDQKTNEDSINLAAGSNNVDIHDVMIDSEKEDIALQFTMQVRNKLLDAYNEIMRMQI